MVDQNEEPTNETTPLLLRPLCCSPSPSVFAAALLTKRNLAMASGPTATLIFSLVSKSYSNSSEEGEPSGQGSKVGPMLGVLVWMACWWILQPIPIAITSLLPLVLFPFFEIMDSDTVSAQYTNSIVVLLIGTFILAVAIQKYDLHRRIALKILLASGGREMNPRGVILGFLSAAAFVSMFMSDTVAAVMLLPVAVGVLNSFELEKSASPSTPPPPPEDASSVEESNLQLSKGRNNGDTTEATEEEEEEEEIKEATVIAEFGKGLVLAVTYGTGLGGMGTLIGSGPNVVLPGFYRSRFPEHNELNFLSWCKFALPMLVPYVVLTWLYLAWYFCPPAAQAVVGAKMNRRMVETEYEALGPISFPETVILIEFIILIVLWVTRVFGEAPGWGALFDNYPSDGTMALLAAILLFIFPNGQTQGERIMDWKSCKELSWGVILLVGGGFALSKGIQVSGLSALIGTKLQFLGIVPYYLVTPVITIILSIVTEFSSNVSVATLFIPILADVAVSTHYHPLLLMVPATFACNYSFNLPSATPPNAIALGTGTLKVKDMAYPGLFMHVVGLLLISVFTPTLGAHVFGLDKSI